MKASYNRLTEARMRELQALMAHRNFTVDPERLNVYSHDEVSGEKYRFLPDIVLYPETTEQIAEIMKWASKNKIPVTPRGAGTGLSGGAVPVFSGIVLSLERMNRILEFDKETLTITVEPGVVTDEIQKAAKSAGLLYAGDPCSSDASFIGGNVAENAGGNKVIKYGATGRHVMGLEVVLPDGNIVQFGGKRVKDVTGYDFVNLMVGSEGTLGIITKIILRLVPLSKYLVDLLVPFKDVETAIAFVPKMITQAKLLPASIEFMDHASLTLTGRFLNSKLPYADAGAHLIIELEENDKEVLFDEYVRIGEMCLKNGALEVFVADNRNTREKIWKARKAIAEAVSSFYPEFCMEDIVVPINRIPQIMEKVGAISERYQLETINFGHAGDGNIHVTFLNDRYTPEQWEQTVEKALEDLYRETVLLGGTLSGEHGIGLKRKKYLSAVLSPEVLELTRRIKAAFDPTGILNPGKIAD
ncbi:MAG TPA: FAD-linked oxidase C-terminal domain-containing protein [Thermotogota bacterium]|nr:FAD-linked oxidase C-terminal domain-containing protein [Thermotogota bacterium]HNR63149.1 FAD-linked oxidase C-terminal domain-containing protein [Thermotogota bacterium]HNT95396.1 FAD-linked oxidase C-terminal domain-containing protein [Thermotogota bacterium]